MLDEAERQQLLQSIPRFEGIDHENIQPLQGGRRAHTLVARSQQDQDKRLQMIEQVRADFANQLQHLDEMDDPLEVYLQHIRWTNEVFPEGHNHESQLEDLLQQASDAFKDDSRYKSDYRYLKCWLERANWSGDPKDVFVFLAENGIGQNFALYYQQYSLLFESRKKYTEACHVLETGIQRLAQPIRNLRTSLEQLNSRIQYKQQEEERQQRQQSQRPAPTQHQTQSLRRPGERTMLGLKLDSRSIQSMSQREFNNMQNTTGSNHLNTSSSSSRRPFGNATATTTIPTSLSTEQPRAATKFRIHQDEDPTSSALDHVFPPASSSSQPQNTSTASFSRKRQENTVPVEPFAGAKLPQKSTLVVRPSTNGFNVFRDDASSPFQDLPEHQNQTEMDGNNNNTSLANNRTAAMEWTQIDRHQQHHQHDNNSRPHRSVTQLSSSTTASHPHDRAVIDQERFMALITSRYSKKEKDYIRRSTSEGMEEIIAVHDNCLGLGELAIKLTFEELRVMKQVNRCGQQQTIEKSPDSIMDNLADGRPSEAVIRCRIGRGRSPTKEYTAETKGAMESIDALFNKQKHDDGSDDDDDDDTNPEKKRFRRTYVDENS